MTSIKNPADLGIWKAVICAVRGRPTDFYPRVTGGNGAINTLATDDILKEFGDASAGWTKLAADAKLDAAIGLARQSLMEVKAQTEYQDQKAGRLLTVATIFSALSGLLFTRFNDAYPVRGTWVSNVPWRFLALLTYVPFILFVLAVLCGALVTFHATRTRFKYEQIETAAADDSSPNSRLFYIPILGVRPSAWARSFVATQQTGTKAALILNPELSQLYFRDLVGETYLIAAKAADKIRFLEEAQRLFAYALRFLLLWLFMLALVSIFVAPLPADLKPTLVQLVPGSTMPRTTLVRIDQSRPLRVMTTIVGPATPATAADRQAANGGKAAGQ